MARIELRIADEEKANWSKLADASGVSLSEWIRDRCNGAEPRRAGVGTGSTLLARQCAELANDSAEMPTAPTKSKTCPHGTPKGDHCWQCGGKAVAE